MDTKVCSSCATVLPRAEFPARSGKCGPCKREYMTAYHRANPRRGRTYPPEQMSAKRARDFKSRMGITIEQRDALLESQGGVCAICASPESGGRGWCTDHDHACCPNKMKVCGKCVRGILCYRCNTLLGHARDNVEILGAAIDFLNDWETRSANA